MVYVAWQQFPSFGLHFHFRLASTRVPLCNRKTLAPYIKSCLTTGLHTFKKSYFYFNHKHSPCTWPGAAVAQSEACSLGMQAASSSIPTSGTFFRGDLVMKTFLRSFSLFRWFKKSSCQLLAKECALSTGKLPRRRWRAVKQKSNKKKTTLYMRHDIFSHAWMVFVILLPSFEAVFRKKKCIFFILKTIFAKTASGHFGFLYSYWSVYSSSTFSTWIEPAIFYNRRAHGLFHVLHANLRLFWCSIHVYTCRMHTRYKTNT